MKIMRSGQQIKHIRKDLESCQAAMKEIDKLLSGLDIARCTEEGIPPVFVVMYYEYIQFQTLTCNCHKLLDHADSLVQRLNAS